MCGNCFMENKLLRFIFGIGESNCREAVRKPVSVGFIAIFSNIIQLEKGFRYL